MSETFVKTVEGLAVVTAGAVKISQFSERLEVHASLSRGHEIFMPGEITELQHKRTGAEVDAGR